jgi:hypothetical protein
MQGIEARSRTGIVDSKRVERNAKTFREDCSASEVYLRTIDAPVEERSSLRMAKIESREGGEQISVKSGNPSEATE